jgi:hypothetical protein
MTTFDTTTDDINRLTTEDPFRQWLGWAALARRRVTSHSSGDHFWKGSGR